jgi:glycosyltransferase involved in cell wall biosynthesis
LGALAERLRAEGISVTNDLATVEDDVDIIHSHHRYESLLAYARFPDKPMILVCHGIFPWQEQPFRAKLNIFRYVAVSEEVKAHLIENHFLDSGEIVVIPNGVDLARFYCRRSVAGDPKQAIILSNNMPENQRSVVQSACERLNIKLTRLGGVGGSAWNVEDYLSQADIVFSLGRGALEAMACKRAAIVYGYSGADGLVTPENFQLFRQKNFSGRTRKLKYSESDLLKEIERYHPSIPEQVFEYVYKEHNIQIIAQYYVELYERAIEHRAKSLAPTKCFIQNLALNEVLNEAEQSKDALQFTQDQLEEKQQQIGQLQQQNARLQAFSDAVRQTLAYRCYKKFIKPFWDRS